MPDGLPHVPLCPFRALTGLDCPGCGSIRAVWSLLHGDVTLAARCNVLLLVVAAAWLVTRRPPPVRALAVALAAFGVVRNLPGVDAWLAPPPV